MATIHYRCCSRLQATITTSLYDAIATTMLSVCENGRALNQNVLERQQPCDDGHVIVLNHYRRSRNAIFAEVLRVEPNAHVITVRQNAANNDALEVAQFTAPDGHTPLRGAIYVLVVGDHVLFTSRGDLSSKRLENYLTWLLRKVEIILPADRKLMLDMRTPRRENIPAKEVRLKLSPLERDDLNGAEVRGRAPAVHVRSAPESVLDSLKVTDAELGRLIGEGHVEVDIILKFKEGRTPRYHTIGALDNLLRNAEDVDEVTFNGPNGPVSALGNRLQARRDIRPDRTLLDPNDARDKLIAQFAEWREQGHIIDDLRAQGGP